MTLTNVEKVIIAAEVGQELLRQVEESGGVTGQQNTLVTCIMTRL